MKEKALVAGSGLTRDNFSEEVLQGFRQHTGWLAEHRSGRTAGHVFRGRIEPANPKVSIDCQDATNKAVVKDFREVQDFRFALSVA